MRKEYHYYIYVLTNYTKQVFYIGFTNDIIRRIIEHKNNLGSDFTRKYNLKYLIYFEECNDVYVGMEREKEIKKWRREKKINLIKTVNPNLNDISNKLFQDNGIFEVNIKDTLKELRERYNLQ